MAIVSGSIIEVINYIDSSELKKLMTALDTSPDVTAVVLHTVSHVWLEDPQKVWCTLFSTELMALHDFLDLNNKIREKTQQFVPFSPY